VYCKPTHTPVSTLLPTLVHSARVLCEDTSLKSKLVFLRDIFRQNGYSDRQNRRALNCRPHLDQLDNKPNSVACLPFVDPIFNRTSRVLIWHNIKSVGLPHKKLCSRLHPVKDHLELRTQVFTGSPVCATGLTRDTAFNSIFLPSSPWKPALLRRPLRLNSTHITSAEKVAFVSVNHGSSYRIPKNFRDMTQAHLVMWSPIPNPCYVDCKQPLSPSPKILNLTL
jgi:hypothetical protein